MKSVKGFLNQNQIWVIILLATACLFIRLYHLADESIYNDEAWCAYTSQQPLTNIISGLMGDQNPPFYFFVLHYWIELTGISDFGLKLLSVIISVITIIVIFLFAKKYFNLIGAYIASFLFLFSNIQLYYAREIRGYALIGLLCICFVWLFFSLLKKPSVLLLIAQALLTLLLCFTHYISVLIPFTFFVNSFFFLAVNKKGVFYYWGSQLLAGILFLPWLKILIGNIPKNGVYWLKSPNYDDVINYTSELAGSRLLLHIDVAILAIFIALVVANSWIRIFNAAFDSRIFLTLLLWCLLPIGADYLIAQITPVFLTRYLLFTTLGFYLLTAYVISSINMRYYFKALCFAPLMFVSLDQFVPIPLKDDDWKDIVPKIARIKDNKTLILIAAHFKTKEFAFYYNRNYFIDYSHMDDLLKRDGIYGIRDAEVDLNKIDFSNIDKVIFLESHAVEWDRQQKARKGIINRGYKMRSQYLNTVIACTGVKATLFEKPGDPSSEGKFTVGKIDTTACNCWEKSILLNVPTRDTSFRFFNDMEKPITCDRDHNLSSEIAWSGNQSSRISDTHNYSEGFVIPLSAVQNKFHVSLTAYVKGEKFDNVQVVISVQNKYYREFKLSEYLKGSDSWQKLEIMCDLPDDDLTNDEVRIYFYTFSKPPCYIDDMEILFSKGFLSN